MTQPLGSQRTPWCPGEAHLPVFSPGWHGQARGTQDRATLQGILMFQEPLGQKWALGMGSEATQACSGLGRPGSGVSALSRLLLSTSWEATCLGQGTGCG